MKTQTRRRWLCLLLAVALVAAACGSSEQTVDDHLHDEGDDQAEDDDHSHDEGEATDGLAESDDHEHDEEGAEFDHHGQPIHDELFYEQVVEDGVSVEFTIQSFLGVGGRGADLAPEVVEGTNSSVIFNITDEAGRPMDDVRPLAWLDYDFAAPGTSCEAQVAGYLSGALTERPLMDFNGYFLLALNENPSISVIDPTVDVGGYTQLFTAIPLNGRGEDWVMTGDESRLVVSVPSTGQLAVIDLAGFVVLRHLDVGVSPVRVALAPDERTVWVGNDTEGDDSGVSVIDPYDLETIGHVATGPGHHELAFSTDGRFAFVTNGDDSTLSVIETADLSEVETINVGEAPAAVAVSTANGNVYVASAGDGKIVVVDGQSHRVIGRLDADPGIASLGFAPGGRWGFASNPEAEKIYIFDATTGAMVYEVPVAAGPDQISFNETTVYVRSRNAAEVTAIALGDLGGAEALEVETIPVGQQAPATTSVSASAAALVTAAAAEAVFLANPAEDMVYLLPVGAQGPSGSFQGHGLFPRAVQLVDRSLRQTAPGVFTGKLRIPAASSFQVAFLLDSPRVVHCFEFSANPDPATTGAGTAAPPDLEVLTENLEVPARQPLSLRVRLTDPASGEPLVDVPDLQIVATATGGNWSDRFITTQVGDGVYEITLTLPSAGFYRLFSAAASLGATVETLPTILIEAT